MSHFYGVLQGNRGEATRCGTAGSGMTTNCAGWGGSILAQAFIQDGVDMYRVYRSPWMRSGGERILLSAGRLQADCGGRPVTVTPWAQELFDSWLPKVDSLETLDWMQRKISHAYTRVGT